MPAARPFHVWPPPYEMPHAPICVLLTSGRPANHVSSARSSDISSGPARPTFPGDVPWPRAVDATTAYPCETNTCATGAMVSFDPPRPCSTITPGHPAAGAAPSGRERGLGIEVPAVIRGVAGALV